MKVKELIAHSSFVAGEARDSAAPPTVTVILPTFRRGDSGLLARAIDSILAQTLVEFELIIVDDASTDSTSRVIAAAMARDRRVSLIRHAFNIGLPAISEFEAYRIARGRLISFAFDDTVFEPEALERLVAASDASPNAMIAGYVRAYHRAREGERVATRLPGEDPDEGELLGGNIIANSAVLLPRHIIDDIGLYDPHVCLARLCDYDLWLRIRRGYAIEFVDVCAGEEHGTATDDSLGATYPLNQWLADDRMRQPRQEQLRPDAFLELDVFDTSAFASPASRASSSALARDHVASRPAMTFTEGDPEAPLSPRVPRILVLGHPLGASLQLVFEAIRDRQDLHVRFADLDWRSVSELAGADALVVVRDLLPSEVWIEAAMALGLPCYYYIDDNLPLMVAKGELEPRLAHFAADTITRAISQFAGVLTSTEELAVSLREQKLHPKIHVLQIAVPINIVAWPRRAPGPRNGQITIALLVGTHRISAFRKLLLPALGAAVEHSGVGVRILVPAPALKGLLNLPLGVEAIPFEPSDDYFVALRRLRDVGVDTVLVPPSPTANQPFKTVHPLLTASALGASLVVPGHEPYLSLSDATGVILANDPSSPEAWQQVFQRLLMGDALESVPQELLTGRFSGDESSDRLLGVIVPQLGPPVLEQSRLPQLVGWLTRQLMHVKSLATSIDTADVAPVVLDAQFAALHRTVRNSRRIHAFSRILSPLAEPAAGAGVETSQPLNSSSYLEYPIGLHPGIYMTARLVVRGSAGPGDLVGIELIDRLGQIVLHTVAALRDEDGPYEVDFRFPELLIARPESYIARVFVRSRRPIVVLERVSRGRAGIARARVSPLLSFVSEDG